MFTSKLLLVLLVCLTIHLACTERNIDIWINQLPNRHTTTTTTTTTTTAQPIRTLPPGYIYFSDIKTAYKIHHDRLNWDSAREACIAEGANLAVIDTWLKLQYVAGMRQWLDWVWTGIYKPSFISNWRTVHGDPLSWPLPWSILNKGFFGRCVAVSGIVNGLGGWMCILPKKYICEIPDAPLWTRYNDNRFSRF